MGNDYVLKIVTCTISVLETDISQISVSALQNEIPSLLSNSVGHRWSQTCESCTCTQQGTK